MPKQKPDPLSLHYGSSQPGKGVLLTPAQKAAAGPQEAPELVKMDVLTDRSYGGKSYHAGDSVEVPEEHVEALTLSGFAARADRVEASKQARDDAKAGREAGEALGADKPHDAPAAPQE